MTKVHAKRKATDRDAPSRPEDPDTQRLKRAKRLLRNDMLPDGAAMVTQAGEADGTANEAALKRAVDDREREEPA